MDGVLPSGILGRHILELEACNMYYNIVKANANKTTAAVFISRLVLSKNRGRVNWLQSPRINNKGDK